MKQIKSLLSSKNNIVITTHVNPDGDAIGSSLALYNFLLKMNHSVNVIVPEPELTAPSNVVPVCLVILDHAEPLWT
mgnify:CR=1 FL=1